MTLSHCKNKAQKRDLHYRSHGHRGTTLCPGWLGHSKPLPSPWLVASIPRSTNVADAIRKRFFFSTSHLSKSPKGELTGTVQNYITSTSTRFSAHTTSLTSARRVLSKSAMGVECLDLLIVPWPPGTQGHRATSDRGERQRDGALFLKTWKALRKLVEAGTVRALGLFHIFEGIAQKNGMQDFVPAH